MREPTKASGEAARLLFAAGHARQLVERVVQLRRSVSKSSHNYFIRTSCTVGLTTLSRELPTIFSITWRRYKAGKGRARKRLTTRRLDVRREVARPLPLPVHELVVVVAVLRRA